MTSNGEKAKIMQEIKFLLGDIADDCQNALDALGSDLAFTIVKSMSEKRLYKYLSNIDAARDSINDLVVDFSEAETKE